ncbi:MAG: hypothetical protein R2761_24645 [Acidimicrobiales bacterium]
MKRTVTALLAGAVALALGVLAGQVGLLRFPSPGLPDVNQVTTEISRPTEARVVAIEPISLDCRARVHAEVPVTATRRHEALGVVYRTDQVTLDAVGDVDTCVDGTAGTTVTHHGDGTVDVVIDARAITFVRPRVDTVASGDGLTEHRGPVGKLTDALPWVDDNLGLTPLAYAYAQSVIGSSACMQTAYTVTEGLLRDAYRQQAVSQGADPALVAVRVDGTPDFGLDGSLAMGGDGIELTVGDSDVTCTVSDSLGDPDRGARA